MKLRDDSRILRPGKRFGFEMRAEAIGSRKLLIFCANFVILRLRSRWLNHEHFLQGLVGNCRTT